MIGKKKKALLSAILGVSLLACVSSNAMAAPYTQKDLNEQGVMGLLWVQTSAEYRELCYQAYNAAMMQVDKAVANHKKGDKPLAIVLDADETVLNNSALQASYIGTNNSFNPKTWTKWVDAAQAKAMPGATKFLQGVAAKGVAIFYVSNRDEKKELAGTIKNMKALGFPDADAQHCLFKTDTGNKMGRFEQVAKKYDIVVFLGDNAGDMPLNTYHKSMEERNAIIDAHASLFGTKFIALPNPEYGDWEGSLAKGYWGMTPAQKDKVRKEHLYKWRQ